MNSTDPLSKRLSYACFTELPLTMKIVLNSNLGQSHFGWLCLTMYANKNLKVPKCESLDRSDFHDFYPIKSLWEGDFGVKIKCLKKNI
jgi:hypothetical protein